MFRFREIHIAPGTAASGCLVVALDPPPGGLLANQDLLSCGPLTPLHSLTEWRDIREQYLRSLDRERQFSFAGFQRDLLTNAETLREAESVILWVGAGLAEQVLLAWIPQLLRLVGADPRRLSIIQFSRLRDYEIPGIGELNPDQLKAHPPAIALDDSELATIDAAWSAVIATDPTEVVTFLSDETGSLPLLRRSLRWWLFRFPDIETGLNSWELSLLNLTAEKGPEAVKIVGYTMARNTDELDPVGDGYLFARLHRLADPSLPHPLLSLSGDTVRLRGTEVYLTDAGRDVMAGKANFVSLNGIDDWVGGIHLDSNAGQVWFQRNGELV